MKNAANRNLFSLLLAPLFHFTASAQNVQLVSTNSSTGGNIPASINEFGQVLYTSADTHSMYLGVPGAPTLLTVATSGSIAGSPPFILTNFSGVFLANGSNQTAFYANDVNFKGGLFANFNGTNYRVAVSSNQATNLPVGVLYKSAAGDFTGNASAMNVNGAFFFAVQVQGTGVVAGSNDYALYKGHPTNLQIVARAGSNAPGYPSGWVFAGNGATGPFGVETHINGNGVGVFNASTFHTNDVNTTSNAFWIHDANGARPFIRFDTTLATTNGTAVPGLPGGIFYNSTPIRITINDAGETAFFATAFRPSPFALFNGFWAGPTNNLQLVVGEGQVAPGTGGASFGSSGLDYNRFCLGSNGTVCFISSISGTGVVTSNNSGLFIGSNTNNLRLIARTGTLAPGCPVGTHFTNLKISSTPPIHAPVIFGTNRVAFSAIVRGPDLVDRWGVWATDNNGDAQLVFLQGITLLELQPGIFHTVDTFFFRGGNGQDGRPCSVNRKGRLVIGLNDITVPSLAGVYILDLGAAANTAGTSSIGTVQFVAGTGFQMNLTLQSGRSYRVQYSTDLTTTNWTTLTNFTSSGVATQIVDSAISGGRYYRVISP